MSERNQWTPAQAVEHGKTHLRFCEENWFKEPAYVSLEGKPLLMVFGPDFLKPAAVGGRPRGDEAGPGVPDPARASSPGDRQLRLAPDVGVEGWQARSRGTRRLSRPLREAGGPEGRLRLPRLPRHLQGGGHAAVARLPRRPQRRDVPAHPGAGPGSGSPIIQLATWNDFGEGTCIEPTREYGYRYLEAIQDARRKFPDEPFALSSGRPPAPLPNLRTPQVARPGVARAEGPG